MTDARLTFAAGYTVTADDMNAVASQLVRTFPDARTRDRILGSDPIPAGALCMLTDTYTLSVWTGSTWSALEGLTRGGDKPYRHFGRIPQRDAKWRVVDGGWIGLVGDYRVPDAAPNIGTIYLSASTDATSLTISWNAVAGATEYQLQEEGDTLTGHTGTSRSFTRTVSPGGTYRWRGRCKNRFGVWSGWSQWYGIRVGSAPSAPGNLRIRGAENGRSVRVTWDAVTGGTRYQLEWRNNALTNYDGASRDRTFSCSPATQYECRVRATNTTGLWSGWSGWAQIRTAGAPSTPSGLSISGATNGQSVRVTWDAVTGGTRYQVQWRNNALTNYDGASRARTFSCSPATQYECRVRATNATGLWSGWSGWVQVRTAGAPSTPSGLSITAATNGQSVQVTWNAVSGGTRYQVQWKNNALTNYEGASRNRTFSCSPATQYECRVRATNTTGLWSGWSSYASVKTDFINAFTFSGGRSYQIGKYRVHVFTSNLTDGRCTIPVTATMYAIGGGGGGGATRGLTGGNGGNGGRVINTSRSFSANDRLTGTVGAGGRGGRLYLFGISPTGGSSGANSTMRHGNYTLTGHGGLGGTSRVGGTRYSHGDGAGAGTNRSGVSLNLTGQNVEYGRGGNRAANNWPHTAGSAGTNAGDGGSAGDRINDNNNIEFGGDGAKGLIAVRYRNKA